MFRHLCGRAKRDSGSLGEVVQFQYVKRTAIERIIASLSIVAGLVAVAYGVITTQRLMALPTGSAKMQEIAKAIQEGANAYLEPPVPHDRHDRPPLSWCWSRFCFIELAGPSRLPDRRDPLGGCRLYRHEDLGAGQRAAPAGSLVQGPGPGPQRRLPVGAVTGMLVVGLALLGVAGYYALLTGRPRLCTRRAHGHRRPGRSRSSARR